MTDMSERIAALAPDQRAVLLQQLKQKGNPSAPTNSVSDEWVVRYKPNDQARFRLFCFSYAGAGASIFRPWVDILSDEVEVCSIQLPGREYRVGSPPYTGITPLEDDLVEAIVPYLDRPFAFYGHSMGALVSFELTRLLRKKYNKYPEHLFLAAYRAPQLPNPNIKIYRLPIEVFKVVLRSEGIDEAILQNEEIMQAMMPTLRADYEACDTHEFREETPLACPFSLFGGLDDVRVSQKDLEPWSQQSSVGCSLTMLPGPHLFIHSAQEQLLTILARELQEHLDTLEQRENTLISA